jgi:hypothetical protein
MTEGNDGGPAFPAQRATEVTDMTGVAHPVMADYPGMSLRDWFAGQALAGILAGRFADTIPHDDVNGGGDAAFYAFQYADAMLSRREV